MRMKRLLALFPLLVLAVFTLALLPLMLVLTFITVCVWWVLSVTGDEVARIHRWSRRS